MIFVQKVKIRLLSRRCFRLYNKGKLNLELRGCTKWHNSCFCENYRGKLDGGWKKSVCIVFHMTRRSRVCGRNENVHPTAGATSCYLLLDTL